MQQTVELTEAMVFPFNTRKSETQPSLTIDWLGMTWDSQTAMVRLSETNAGKIRRRLFVASVSLTMSRPQWESLLGSFNFAAEVLHLGRLRLRRLVRAINRRISVRPRDTSLPQEALPLIQDWLDESLLSEWAHWTPPLPTIRVISVATNRGWGYQSNQRHQVFNFWLTGERDLHINTRELILPLFFLQQNADLEGEVICFDMGNTAAVHCIARQGTSRPDSLLFLSEQIFDLAESRQIEVLAQYLPGEDNEWVDALSRFRGSSVEWTLN